MYAASLVTILGLAFCNTCVDLIALYQPLRVFYENLKSKAEYKITLGTRSIFENLKAIILKRRLTASACLKPK